MTSINICTIDEEIESIIKWLSNEQKKRLLESLKKEKEYAEKRKPNPELLYNKEAVINDLKENHVKIIKNQEMLWHHWKIVQIVLPAVWKFEWRTFRFFVSSKSIKKQIFKKMQNTQISLFQLKMYQSCYKS